MLANRITLSRLPILLANILILYFGSPALRLFGVGLLFLGLILDTVDGMVARRRGESSLLGSVLDIAADRTYELVLWVCFADLRLIPVAIPMIVIARTTVTDALRTIGIAEGVTPFDQHRTALGRFLVGSAWMRVGYAGSKILAFCGLALVHAEAGVAISVVRVIAWVAVAFCVGRGLPVMIHALRQHWPPAENAGAAAA